MDCESTIQMFRESLSLDHEFSLRDTIRQLEAKVVGSYGYQEEHKLDLWICLIRLSVELQNLKLAKIILQKLNLNDLLTTLDYIEEKRSCKSSYFSILISFFKLDINSRHSHLSRPASLLVDDLHESIKTFNLARQYELEEDYNLALETHEQCSTHLDHCVRLILKRSMQLSYNTLKSYLVRDDMSKVLLADLACHLGDFEYAIDLHKSNNNLAAVVRIAAATSGIKSAENCVLNGQLSRLHEYDLVENNSISELKRRVQCLTLIATSINKQSRKALFELARIYHTSGNLVKACSIYLSLGLVDQALKLPHKRLKRGKLYRQLWRDSNSPTKALYSLVDQLTQRGTISDDHSGKIVDKLFLFLKLGMYDEVLQSLCCINIEGTSSYAQDVIETLRLIIRKRDRQSFNNVDVQITESTLRKLLIFLSDDQMHNTNAITILVLCTTLYLIKIDLKKIEAIDVELSMLEIIFGYLSRLVEMLKFNATDLLTSSTNSLIGAVKERLVIINDSDKIKDAFRSLVETISNECMVGGQYKSAAMLYASIEDNIKAVKSLMRTGEVDIVVNFSLLVKDIAVNRITVNYLRHCGVDQSVIEDFTERIKK